MIEVSENIVEEQLLKYGSYATNTVGVSMKPLFKTKRDVVIIKKPDGELKKYDVALYPRGDKYVLHRVIKVRDDDYVIRGDNTFALEHIAKERIIGVLTEFNRKGKHHSVTDFSFRVYSRVWNFIYPIRYLVHLPRPILVRIYRRLFKRKSV